MNSRHDLITFHSKLSYPAGLPVVFEFEGQLEFSNHAVSRMELRNIDISSKVICQKFEVIECTLDTNGNIHKMLVRGKSAMTGIDICFVVSFLPGRKYKVISVWENSSTDNHKTLYEGAYAIAS